MAFAARLALKQCSSCFGVVTKLSAGQGWRSVTTSTTPLLFRASAPLEAEPMKKRKKLDMNIIVQRETKKRKKIEKAIKKLELKGRQLKPIDEIEGDRSFIKTLDKRKRETSPVSYEESEHRAALVKTWSRYKRDQFVHEMNEILRVQRSQRKALDELRQESEELYQLAIELDEKLIPFEMKGPVDTPPIKGYAAPDGDYINTTKKFDK